MKTPFILTYVIILFGISHLTGQSVKTIRFEKLISLQFGVGTTYYTFSDTDDELIASHNDKWRNALNFSALIGFHPNDKWMLSLTSSLNISEARTDRIGTTVRGIPYRGYLEDQVELFSVGVNAEQTVFELSAVSLSYHVGVNIFYLENNGRLIVDDFKLSGTDVGFRIGINGDWAITNRMSLIGQVQYAVNVVGNPSYEVNDPKIPVIIPSQDMSRVEFNVGIRYSFLKKKNGKKQVVPEPDDEYVPKKRFE